LGSVPDAFPEPNHKKEGKKKMRIRRKNKPKKVEVLVTNDIKLMTCPFCGGGVEVAEKKEEPDGDFVFESGDLYCSNCKKVVGGYGFKV
jgi:uncharacterized protein YbaR (Trm112 family)